MRPDPDEVLDLAVRRLVLILSIVEGRTWIGYARNQDELKRRLRGWENELETVEADLARRGLLRERP